MRTITSLDAIIGPLPEEVTTAIEQASSIGLGISSFIIPAIALVAFAALGIIIFSRKNKTE